MKATNGSDQHIAIKVMKKSHIITYCNVSCNVTEKEALILSLVHPFIMTLYLCFQTKVILIFLNLLHISRESLLLKFTWQR